MVRAHLGDRHGHQADWARAEGQSGRPLTSGAGDASGYDLLLQASVGSWLCPVWHLPFLSHACGCSPASATDASYSPPWTPWLGKGDGSGHIWQAGTWLGFQLSLWRRQVSATCSQGSRMFSHPPPSQRRLGTHMPRDATWENLGEMPSGQGHSASPERDLCIRRGNHQDLKGVHSRALLFLSFKAWSLED